MGSVGSSATYSVPAKQSEWEEKYRYSNIEHGAYFDKDGNLLLEGTGDKDKIDFDSSEINHEVEQRIWADEEVNFSHNHPENTIFSPEDIEVFEVLESHSERANLPNGVNYTIIREQPRTSNEWIYNTMTGEFEQTFTPKKIAPAYRKEYESIFDPGWEQVKATTRYGTPERKKAEAELDRKVADHMEAWLRKNAKSYGYRFVKTTKG